jgi:hypothetical protein
MRPKQPPRLSWTEMYFIVEKTLAPAQIVIDKFKSCCPLQIRGRNIRRILRDRAATTERNRDRESYPNGNGFPYSPHRDRPLLSSVAHNICRKSGVAMATPCSIVDQVAVRLECQEQGDDFDPLRERNWP